MTKALLCYRSSGTVCETERKTTTSKHGDRVSVRRCGSARENCPAFRAQPLCLVSLYWLLSMLCPLRLHAAAASVGPVVRASTAALVLSLARSGAQLTNAAASTQQRRVSTAPTNATTTVTMAAAAKQSRRHSGSGDALELAVAPTHV